MGSTRLRATRQASFASLVEMKLSRRHLRIAAALVAIGSILVFAPWKAAWLWLTPLPETLQEQVDDAVEHGLDGIIVYVDERGKAPTLVAAGWKDRDARVAADPRTLFKIASISKLYIAAAAVKLAGAGRLSLDESVAARLPALAPRIENSDRITLRMLVQHRSGIPDFVSHEEFDWSKQPRSVAAALELALDEPADFAPDRRDSYSNTNYLLLGEVLDAALGYSHRRYVERELLAPLGLTHTYGLLAQVDSGELASGYHSGIESDMKSLDYVIAGGSMVATAQDVGVFLRALTDGPLLSDAERAVYSSLYEYEHTGWLPGYHSIARYHPDIDAVVVQFVNTTGGDSELVSNIVYDRVVRIVGRR